MITRTTPNCWKKFTPVFPDVILERSLLPPTDYTTVEAIPCMRMIKWMRLFSRLLSAILRSTRTRWLQMLPWIAWLIWGIVSQLKLRLKVERHRVNLRHLPYRAKETRSSHKRLFLMAIVPFIPFRLRWKQAKSDCSVTRYRWVESAMKSPLQTTPARYLLMSSTAGRKCSFWAKLRIRI